MVAVEQPTSPIGNLERQESCPQPSCSHTCSLGRHLVSRGAREVAQHLPPNARIPVQQPPHHIHPENHRSHHQGRGRLGEPEGALRDPPRRWAIRLSRSLTSTRLRRGQRPHHHTRPRRLRRASSVSAAARPRRLRRASSVSAAIRSESRRRRRPLGATAPGRGVAGARHCGPRMRQCVGRWPDPSAAGPLRLRVP